MNKKEARRIALERACGVLQSYLDAGSLYEECDDLPEKEVAKIDEQVREIIQSLWNRLIQRKAP